MDARRRGGKPPDASDAKCCSGEKIPAAPAAGIFAGSRRQRPYFRTIAVNG
jgi:hypothetical protein